ncbi:MAG: Ig-like domain repeat protein [Isosphaeraceae bacterium]
MLDAASGLTVGRSLSAWTTADVVGNSLTIRYTVYNEASTPLEGVLLTSSLQPGVTFAGASLPTDRNGQALAWGLGTIAGYGRSSVDVTVTLTGQTPLTLDGGARAFGTIDAHAVTDDAPAATLRPGSVNAALLASTSDANTTDPFVQQKAAQLDYDPQRIFAYLSDEVAYESYIGSVRGARGTIWSEAGNSLDEASLGVALMRASGIPARYARGTLSDAQARQLILSMFPEAYRTVGFISPGVAVADPANDPNLLAETRDHFWLQFDAGGGFQNADAAFAGATVGQTLAPLASTFAEVPDALREKTTVRVNAELTSASLLGGTFQRVTTVLDQTYDNVDLVGRPLTIGHFFSTHTAGFIITARTNTYSPYIVMGDEAYDFRFDDLVRGDDFQEVLTNFPFGSQTVTGVFLEVDLSGPSGPTRTYERAILDRIGYEARRGLVNANVTVDPNSSQAVTELDLLTLVVNAGRGNPRPSGVFRGAVDDVLSEIADSTLLDLPVDAQYATFMRNLRDGMIAATREIATNFISQSDEATDRISERSLIKAYFDRPRLIIVSNRFPGAQDRDAGTLAIDLRRDSIRALPFPGQDESAALVFATVRGIAESVLEGEVMRAFVSRLNAGQTTVGIILDVGTIFTAARAQGIAPVLIRPDNPGVLQGLALSDQAKARITSALDRGQDVIVPSRMVDVDGVTTVAWYEIDPNTGEAIGVGEDGGRPSPFFWAGLAIFALLLGTLEVAGLVQCIFPAFKLFDINKANLGEERAYQIALGKLAECEAEFHSNAGKALIAMAKGLLGILAGLGKAVIDRIPPLPPLPGLRLSIQASDGPEPRTVLGLVDDLSEYIVLARASGSRHGTIDLVLDSIEGRVPGAEPTISPLSAPGPFKERGANRGEATAFVPSTISAGAVAGTARPEDFTVFGPLSASWSSRSTTGFQLLSLAAAIATVTDANGNSVGAGAIALATDVGVATEVGGVVSYQVTGEGRFSFQPGVTGALAASTEWDDFQADVTGDAILRLTTDRLRLNGNPLPAGTYTIRTTSATLTGEGRSTSPNFAGSMTITANGGTVRLGPSAGGLNVGGQARDVSRGVALSDYAGTVGVTVNGGAYEVVLGGQAGGVLAVASNLPTFSTDQNGSVSFRANVLTNLGGDFAITAQAPEGWTVVVDAGGNVTANPAPGLQGGTHAIRIVARSADHSQLVAGTVVNVTITPTAPGFAMSIERDLELAVPFLGAEFPSAFQVEIQNTGPTIETYDLSFSNLPAGFSVLQSRAILTVPAGRTGVVGLYFLPDGALPAPGTLVSVEVTATPGSVPGLAQTQTASFTVPEVHGVTISSDPPVLNTSPGGAVTATLALRSVGNVPESVVLEVTTPTGLVANVPERIDLGVGEVRTVTLTLNADGATPLNSTLLATIAASFGLGQVRRLTLPVRIAVPGADAIANASDAAERLGNPDLADRLGALSTALTDLFQGPTNPVFKAQALANLDSVSNQLGADPNLVGLADGLAAPRAALAAATTADEVRAAAGALGAALDSLGARLSDLAAHRFDLSLVSSTQVVGPLATAEYELVIQNTGTATTTYAFAFENLPAGFDASFSDQTITLAPGEVVPTIGASGVLARITPLAGTAIAPTGFTIRVTAQEAPAISRTVDASLTARDEILSVISVGANPPFADPGTSIAVSARVLNAVNSERVVLTSFEVLDGAGNPVFVSTPVEVTLGILTTLTTVPLGEFDTTGRPLGSYTIRVVLTDAAGNPIDGGVGQGSLLIGTPVTATIALDADVLPPGDSVATTTLEVSSRVGLLAPLSLIGQVRTTGVGQGIALLGTIAYVGVPGQVQIVDVSDPMNPVLVKVFGGPDIRDNAEVRPTIDGDLLYVRESRGTTTPHALYVYSLTDPLNPVLLGRTDFNYSFTGTPVFHQGYIYVNQVSFQFSVGSNNIFAQHGELISLNVTDPTNPTLNAALFRQPPGGSPNGGDFNTWQITPVSANTLYVGSTTSTGGDTSGVGRLLIVDKSDPDNLTIANELLVPGMTHVIGIGVYGTHALLIGSSSGWQDPFNNDNAGLTGNVVLATIDVSDARNPTILHTRSLARGARGAFGLHQVRPGIFASYSIGHAPTVNPALIVIDANDPLNLIVSETATPEPLNRIEVEGDFLFATGSSGLFVYSLDTIDVVPTTVSVPIPNGQGTSVIPGSFNVAPTRIMAGAGFDTYEWDFNFTSGNANQTITWETNVTGLQPGERRTTSLEAAVSFTALGAQGAFDLPPLQVAGEQVLGLSPASRTVRPGETAEFLLHIGNPTATSITYAMEIQGVRSRWSNLPATITVPARGSVDYALKLKSEALAEIGEHDFVVTATAGNGATGSVHGTLVLVGNPVLPDAEARAVVIALDPTQAATGQGTPASYTVRVTNAGSLTETFTLTVSLPDGIVGLFDNVNVTVPPGASNFRDVRLTLTPAVGSAIGNRSFTVQAVSTADPSVSAATDGTLSVRARGVRVALSPSSNSPGGAFAMTVTNTGNATDTFDLSLGGPAGLKASLEATTVTLAPGASRVVGVTTDLVDFALAGELTIIATGASRADAAVRDNASATLQIAPVRGLAARLDPPSTQLAQPGPALVLLRVDNTGNTEDAYIAEILGSSGPISAFLIGLDGLPAQSIPHFQVPGLSSAIFQLRSTLASAGSGTITVRVRSLNDPTITTTTTATIATGQAATTTTLVVTPHRPRPGDPVTLSATVVLPPGVTGPLGTVTFVIDGVDRIPPVPVVLVNGQGVATLVVNDLPVGPHSIQAVYNGVVGLAAPSVSELDASIEVVNDAAPPPPPPSQPIGNGPRVISVQRVGVHLQPTRLILRFDQALNPVLANDSGNYQVLDARGRSVPIGAVYDPATRTVTLFPSRLLGLHERYRLVVNGNSAGGLTDLEGRLLDGDLDGLPGGSYVATIDRGSLVGPPTSAAAPSALPVRVYGPRRLGWGSPRPHSVLRPTCEFRLDRPVYHAMAPAFTRQSVRPAPSWHAPRRSPTLVLGHGASAFQSRSRLFAPPRFRGR